jgi:hypothetical protein
MVGGIFIAMAATIIVTALFSVAGALSYILVIEKLEPVQWTAGSATSASIVVEPGLP